MNQRYAAPVGARLSFLHVLLVMVLAIWVGGCKGDAPPPPFEAPIADVVCVENEDRQSLQVDIYLDATTSMEGYAKQGSTYGRFLDALEGSITAGWPEADVGFYMFGTRVDSIGRESFLSAKTDLAFYRHRGLFETTNIDSVLARTDPERVSIIVTDLFQSDGDTNALIQHIEGRGL